MKRTIVILLAITILVANIWAQNYPATAKCFQVVTEETKYEIFRVLIDVQGSTANLVGVKFPKNEWYYGQNMLFSMDRNDGFVLTMMNAIVVKGKTVQMRMLFNRPGGVSQIWHFNENSTFTIETDDHGVVNMGLWNLVNLVNQVQMGTDGQYIDPTGSIQLSISGNYFTIAMNGRDVAAGNVDQQNNQLILRDSRDMTIWTIMEDGSLYTNTRGLAGTWKKVQ